LSTFSIIQSTQIPEEPKKGDIIAEAFNPKDLAKLVIHFNSVFTHKMADRMTLDGS
jgi:hypothetical protein